MRWRFITGIGLFLALTALPTARGEPPPPPDRDAPVVKTDVPAKELATPLIQRVVLLTPLSPLLSDPNVQKILAFERAAREKARRKPGGFTLRLPGTTGKPPMPSPSPPKPSATAPPKTNETPPGDNISTAYLQAVADALLADAMAEHLRKIKIVVVPEAELKDALGQLKMNLSEASRPENAEKLRAQLNGDAVLTLSPARIRMSEQKARTVALWVTVRVPALRTSRCLFPPLTTPAGAPSAEEPLAPLTEFAAFGAATSGHAFLKSTFARTPPSLAQSAAQEAAAIALHALRTGSPPVFPREGAQIALAPVPSPTQADQLLFALDGRQSLPGAVRGLPADLSERFRPDLLPLFPEAVRDAVVTRQALQALHLTPDALWEKEQTPNRERVQALGRRQGVGYVLLARITDIEVDSSAPSQRHDPANAPSISQRGEATLSGSKVQSAPAPPGSFRLAPVPIPPWERQGRAEAIGVLVRVRDGAVLWQDRATATMSSRQVVTGEAQIQAANRQTAEDATRFALLQLQRQFRAYLLEATR